MTENIQLKNLPQIMGILNVTPDSFSDGGKYTLLDAALQHALQMQQQGATIIDIGGESTRPNAAPVSEQQELDRVLPIVEQIRQHSAVNISIDTSNPKVFEQAHQRGANIWNDVRALTRPHALDTAAKLNCPVVLMHMRGEPNTMNDLAVYTDVIAEVKAELMQKVQLALQAGIQAQNIILDLGFGFAKTTAHNLTLLKHQAEFTQLGYPLLMGVSRKRFLGEVTGHTQASDRIYAGVAAAVLAAEQGVKIIRTHDVKATVDALKLWQAVQNTP